MNVNYPIQTRDLRPALLLLASAALLLVSLFTTNALSRLAYQESNQNFTAQEAAHSAVQALPAFQAQRPPEPPAGGGHALIATATPAPSSRNGGQNLAPRPTALPVATPPASH